MDYAIAIDRVRPGAIWRRSESYAGLLRSRSDIPIRPLPEWSDIGE